MADYTHILPEDEDTLTAYAPGAHCQHLLEIDRHGVVTLRADINRQRDVRTTDSVNRGITVAIHALATLDVAALRAGLVEGGELSVLIDRIIEGHAIRVVGSYGMDTGSLDQDAEEAVRQLERLLGQEDSEYRATVEAVPAKDWLLSDMSAARLVREHRLSKSSTKADIEAVANTLIDYARSEGAELHPDEVDAVLRQGINDLRDT